MADEQYLRFRGLQSLKPKPILNPCNPVLCVGGLQPVLCPRPSTAPPTRLAPVLQVLSSYLEVNTSSTYSILGEACRVFRVLARF
jgi:hypothetical protein